MQNPTFRECPSRSPSPHRYFCEYQLGHTGPHGANLYADMVKWVNPEDNALASVQGWLRGVMEPPTDADIAAAARLGVKV